MGRSSRLSFFVAGLALLPTGALAQFYGFPSEVGVQDDGFGVLPPLPPAPPPFPANLPEPSFAGPPAPPPCPLVIKVGRGLRSPSGARVVYGRPACS